jgi:primosomal protein N' (replication factor Y)
MSAQQRDLFEREPAPWELDDQDEVVVASVVFSEKPYGPYDYLVPTSLIPVVQVGIRVRVPLGRGNRKLVGYCIGVENRTGGGTQLKPVSGALDSEPLLTKSMLRLTEWMADHYLCPLGQVLEGIIPAGVRGQAGTREQLFLSVPTSVTARLTQLKLPVKQAAALKILAASPRPLTPPELAKAAGCTQAPIQALRRKNLVRGEMQRIQQVQIEEVPETRESHLELNDDQRQVLDAILEPLRAGRHETVLIHGVTGSGKTEVYIRAIDEVIQYGRQALVLVPEISLTPQTRQRFRSRFDRVAVLHSRLSPSERHWHWQQIAKGDIQVVVGARSAVFAPTPNLGLIVLDEEHDASFKQDTVPRYHARDVAIRRAELEQIPLILGSATPSLESFYEAKQGRFRLLEMPRRVSNLPLPDVTIVDLRNEFQGQRNRGSMSSPLLQAMRLALQDDGQIILLLNRRGFSTSIQCPACGYVIKCPDCDIALTHHRQGEKAICHYCDHEITAPTNCPECNNDGIRYAGLGTQRLEVDVRARFPGVPILRMDSDTMQKPGSHEQALARFRSGEVKVLLGTQMIAKGLDFPNVTLVGVINADTALHFPDFRAAERTFQLVTQVAGRTGRGERGGRVLVQTFSPDHPAILAAQRHDYLMFASNELPSRHEFGYPPASSMIRIVIRGACENSTERFAQRLADKMRGQVEQHGEAIRILGPAEAPIAKLRGKFRYHILLHGPDNNQLRQVVRDATQDVKTPDEIQWIVDVDPVAML